MPTMQTFNFVFGGVQTIPIYSQEEMAKALKISVTTLKRRLAPGGGLSYFEKQGVYRSNRAKGSVRLVGWRYTFNQASYDHNLERAGRQTASR